MSFVEQKYWLSLDPAVNQTRKSLPEDSSLQSIFDSLECPACRVYFFLLVSSGRRQVELDRLDFSCIIAQNYRQISIIRNLNFGKIFHLQSERTVRC